MTMSPVLRRLVPAFVLLTAALPVAGTVRAEDPAPAAATDSDAAAKANADKRWMLKFSRGALQRILVDDGSGTETTYMYMLFSVTNDTAYARPWYPLVTATLDTRKERPYYAGGFPIALERIRRKVDDASLQAVETTWSKGLEGRIQVGETKKLVAIFGPVDPGWATFHVEFHGLLNPQTTIKVHKYDDTHVTYRDPVYAERNAAVLADLKKAAGGADVPEPPAEYHVVFERRVWAVDFARKGDEFRPDDDPITFVGERWTVLGTPKYVRTVK